MMIGVLKEIAPDEKRVAAVPDTVSKFIKNNMTVCIETDAGLGAHISDDDYKQAGAQIGDNAEGILGQADIILKVHRPLLHAATNMHEIDGMKNQSILIAPLNPLRYPELLAKLNAKQITAFSLDLLPRIARAQSMDILSSMSNLAGYKSVLLAADHLDKIFPMMTTAAGTILPAKVIVIGAGVAGLQAIATARRLGAVVIAFDTRPIAAEQVKSLGADFVSLETTHAQSEDAGGYAKEQSAEFYKQEQDIIHRYIKDADVVITTALIPGKRAPILITAPMVEEMKRGSVIVDLSIEQGGNCELTEAGKISVKHDITLIGLQNLPSMLPVHASQLYAKNMYAFLNYITPQLHAGKFDFADDIIKGCLITYQGETVHPLLKQTISQKG